MSLRAEAAEFSPGLLAITDSPPPKLPRAVLTTVVSLCSLMLLWAFFGKLDIVATADGKLVPQTYVKIVQPAEAGIVTEILVKEGDEVSQGQPLIRLDPTVTGADSQSVAEDIALKRMSLRRIDAELAGQPLAPMAGDSPLFFAQVLQQGNSRSQAYLDALAQETAARERALHDLRAAQETLHKLRSTLPSYEQSADAFRKLRAEGFVSPLASNDKEREAIEKAQDLKAQVSTVDGLQATIAAQDKKIATLTSNYRSQLLTERTELMGSLSKLEQDRKKAAFKGTLLELKAPQAGVVKDLATNTRGAVVQPGMVLLTLVPKGEQMVAEVQVKNEDIGFVQAGQNVRVKLAAYPFQKYGLLDGTVLNVATDAQGGNGGANASSAATGNGSYGAPATTGYKAIIRLQTQYLQASDGNQMQRYPLGAGMQATAEIHQGHRTVMEYLLSPVQKVAAEAGRER